MVFGRFKDENCNHRGAAAEKCAQQYLQSNHLRILSTNYKTPRGEIDIIASDGDTIVFAEVRLRSNMRFGNAADSIDLSKQKRIISAAKHYLQAQSLWDKVNCRFDALCLQPDPYKPDQYQVEWIPAAFGAD